MVLSSKCCLVAPISTSSDEDQPSLLEPYSSWGAHESESVCKWYVYFMHVVLVIEFKCCLIAPISTSTVSVLNITRVSVCI